MKVTAPERDTSSGRRQPVPRDMQEYCTAPPGDTRPRVVVDLDEEIVKAVSPAEAVSWFIGRPYKGPVIAPVAGVFAPGIVTANPPDRKQGARSHQSIGAPPHPYGSKLPSRGGTIAFALVGADTGTAERDRDGETAGAQPALCSAAWPGGNADSAERYCPHVRSRPTRKCRLPFLQRMFYFARDGAAKQPLAAAAMQPG